MNAQHVTPIPESLVQQCLYLLEYETKIKTLRLQLKELINDKKSVSESVMSEMQSRGFSEVETDIGTVHLHETKRKETLNENYLQTALMDIFKDKHKVDEVKNSIMKGRKTKSKECIKVTQAKAS